MKQTTLCYPIVDGRVLLAMKKRGLGAGKWNGPGGKLEDGETPEAACVRETQEEVGATPTGLESRGVIEFVFLETPEWDNRCTVFVARGLEGEPEETEEMRPQWYPLEAVPYAAMWDDDPLWLPAVLAGGTVSRRFFFDADGKVVRKEEL